MADIFISYSRQDSTFVEQLRTALTTRGRSAWLDTSDIAPTSVWRQDIVSALEAASAVLFVISPSWVTSEVSQRELQFAIQMHKKLVPIVLQDVDHRLVHPALAEINWIMARPGDNLNEALQRILFAIDVDLPYWRQGGDLLVKASQWNDHKRQPAYTLRGEALRQAEQWLAEGVSKRPAPNPLQVEYITAGRRAAAARQRTTIGALSTGIIITLILSIVAGFLAVTIHGQNDLLTTQNRQLAIKATENDAREQYNGDKIDLALLLAAAAYKVGQPGDPTTRRTLFSLVHQSPHLDQILLGSTTSSYFDLANYIGYSADGNTLALVRQQEVSVLFTNRPALNFTPSAPPGEVTPNILGGALTSDGSLVAVKVGDSTNGSHLTLWSTKSGKEVRQLDGLTYEGQTQQHDIAFSPNGSFLASAICPDSACSKTEFTIWDVKTGHIVAQIPGHYALGVFYGASVSFSANSRYVAFDDTPDSDVFHTAAQVVVFDLEQRAVNFILNSPVEISALAFSPSPDVVAVASSAGSLGLVQQVAFWNVVTQARVGQVTTIDVLNPIQTIEFSSQLHWMLTADTLHTVNFWGVDSSFSTIPLTTDVAPVRSLLTAVGFSPDGETITTSSEDGQIVVWRLSPFTSSSPDATLTFGDDSALAFTSDSRRLVFADDKSETVRSWDVIQGRAGVTMPSPPNATTQVLATSRDGSVLVSAGATGFSPGTLTFYNQATGKVEGRPLHTSLFSFGSVQFSPDGRTLLGCGVTAAAESLCLLWDVQSHAQVQSFSQVSPGKTQVVLSGSFSPDGKSIGFGVIGPSDTASGGYSGQIAVYSILNQRVSATLEIGPVIPLATSWSPDSRYVGYLDTHGDVAIWNPTSRAHSIHVTKVPSGIQPSFQFVAPPPGADSKSYWIMVATGASLELWQIDQQDQPSAYLDPLFFDSPIFSAASSPDGKYLAVGENTTGLISVISLDPTDWIKEACSIANRNLTRQEWQTYIQALEPQSVPYQTLCPGLPT